MSELVTIPSYKPAGRRAGLRNSKRPEPTLALVVPALREAQNIFRVLAEARSTLEGTQIRFEILVVDDDSRDGTEGIVSAMARDDPRVRLLVRRRQKGLAGAILHGWRHSNAPLLGVMDADGQHPARALPALVDSILAGADVAIGSRFALGGRDDDWNPMRRLMSAVATWAARPLQRPRVPVADPLSGFFLVRRRCLDKVLFQPRGFKLLLEILARGQVNSAAEVPIAFGPRLAGKSKLNVPVAWDYLKLLLKLYRLRLGPHRF